MKIVVGVLLLGLCCPVAHADDQDVIFLQTLTDKGLTYQAATAVQRAQLICGRLDQGYGYADTVYEMTETIGGDVGDVNAFAITSVSYYCPGQKYRAIVAQSSFPPYARRMP